MTAVRLPRSLMSSIFTSCFYFRVINYIANFTRAVPLHLGRKTSQEPAQAVKETHHKKTGVRAEPYLGVGMS